MNSAETRLAPSPLVPLLEPGNIWLRGTLEVPLERLTAVKAGLAEHIRLTRAEHGCLYFFITPMVDRPGHFWVEEGFVDADAFAAHQARTQASAWATLTAGCHRQYEQGVVEALEA